MSTLVMTVDSLLYLGKITFFGKQMPGLPLLLLSNSDERKKIFNSIPKLTACLLTISKYHGYLIVFWQAQFVRFTKFPLKKVIGFSVFHSAAHHICGDGMRCSAGLYLPWWCDTCSRDRTEDWTEPLQQCQWVLLPTGSGFHAEPCTFSLGCLHIGWYIVTVDIKIIVIFFNFKFCKYLYCFPGIQWVFNKNIRIAINYSSVVPLFDTHGTKTCGFILQVVLK